MRRPVEQGLEHVRALARQVGVRIAVVVHVVARDPHPVEPDGDPPVVGGVEPRRLPGRDPPQLVLPVGQVAVVLAIVADPEVAPPRPVPVAEQEGLGTPGWSQRHRRAEVRAVGSRSDEHVVGAQVVGVGVVRVHDVVAEGERGQCRRSLHVALKPIVMRSPPSNPNASLARSNRQSPTPAEEHVFAAPQDREVDDPVAVDVERVSPGDVGQIGCRIVDRREVRSTAGRRVVPLQDGRAGSAGEIQIWPPVTVAVEDGHAPADRERVRPIVGKVDSRGSRDVDEVRCRRGPWWASPPEARRPRPTRRRPRR